MIEEYVIIDADGKSVDMCVLIENDKKINIINSNFARIDLSFVNQIDMLIHDPMYHMITSRIGLYKPVHAFFNAELIFHFTHLGTDTSNDKNSNPGKIASIMNDTYYHLRISHMIQKYDFTEGGVHENVKKKLGSQSHCIHQPPRDTDSFNAYAKRKTPQLEHWNRNSLEYSQTLRKYIPEFNPANPCKPQSLYEDFYNAYSRPNGCVVDMNAGSGNSLFAAYYTSRNYIGYEVDKHHYNKIVQKMKSL